MAATVFFINKSERAVFWLIVICLIWYGITSLGDPNESQEKFVQNAKVDFKKFTTYACEQKESCKKYAEVLKSCAEAGSIKKCVEIRMEKASYEACTDEGINGTFPADATPSALQCLYNKIQ
jgi:hypothetical protein